MSASLTADSPQQRTPHGPHRPWLLALICLLFLFVISAAFGPITPAVRPALESAAMQTSRQIALALFSYSNDNNGQYPDGNSSTEVFQKLLDGGYITDPSIFYVPLPGKMKAADDQKMLKPENVCFDVTGGVDGTSPDGLPIVFLTGYKVTYAPGTAAVPLPETMKNLPRKTWWRFFNELWSGRNLSPPFYTEGMPVAYHGNSAKWRINVSPSGGMTPDGSVSNFVPVDFKPDGKTYRQLTPTGPMP